MMRASVEKLLSLLLMILPIDSVRKVKPSITMMKDTVSAPVAEAMAAGARKVLNADIAVSVTGLAGPGGDEYGNPVGTVYIGYADRYTCFSRKFLFKGDRNDVRQKATCAALELILSNG